mmetsp:Transcript_15416/g.31775  ORF Transcript_15416/g.31775 Transcript_15416/m.31775 type:complete len:309 (+) Transcript_15416:129-1055(+)
MWHYPTRATRFVLSPLLSTSKAVHVHTRTHTRTLHTSTSSYPPSYRSPSPLSSSLSPHLLPNPLLNTSLQRQRQRRRISTHDGNDNANDDANAKTKKSDLLVILDMDECLIHSQFFGSKEYRQLESRPDLLNSPSSPTKKTVSSFDLELPDGDVVRVNKRPGLDSFLSRISSLYEVHVFTAAMSVYASPVLDVLESSGPRFTNRYYRECCVYDDTLNVYVKDLTNLDLEHPMSRVVLVDNNPMSFLAQPSNGVLVSNFYDDPEDGTLRAVEGVLERIDKEEDVRGTLDNMFGLRDALRDVRENGGNRR